MIHPVQTAPRPACQCGNTTCLNRHEAAPEARDDMSAIVANIADLVHGRGVQGALGGVAVALSWSGLARCEATGRGARAPAACICAVCKVRRTLERVRDDLRALYRATPVHPTQHCACEQELATPITHDNGCGVTS